VWDKTIAYTEFVPIQGSTYLPQYELKISDVLSNKMKNYQKEMSRFPDTSVDSGLHQKLNHLQTFPEVWILTAKGGKNADIELSEARIKPMTKFCPSK
jgi:hypothetical protein